jgi:hypothetical protein
VVIGGWSERCFSRSDERWLTGWAERLKTTLMIAEAEKEDLGVMDFDS